METKKKRNLAERKNCRPAFAALHILALCMMVTFILTACRQEKENLSVSPDSHPIQQDADTSMEEKNTVTALEAGSDRGSAGSTEASDNKSNSSSADQPQGSLTGRLKRKEIYDVGDSLKDGDLRITYTASGEYYEESEYQQPEADHKYIYLEFAFENTGDKEECPVSLFAFQCFADGFTAPAYYGGEKDLPASLPAGRYAVGNLYFSVPEDAEKIEVEYQPDSPAEEKVRFSYEGEKDSGYVPQVNTSRTQGAFSKGETAASDLQRILYLSCQADDSDNENVHPGEGCTYWTLTFEFENLQKEDRQVSVHDFTCYADGRNCARTLFRDDYLSADIPGGRKAKGTVTFEVPDDAQTVEVEYDTGRRSDAHVVFTVR